MKKSKKYFILIVSVVATVTMIFSQGGGYLSQKLMVENNIRDRVKDALSKLIESHKYVINVDVELEVLEEVNEQFTYYAPRSNETKKQKSGNRRIQITFINPPHHGKGRSGTDYQESEN